MSTGLGVHAAAGTEVGRSTSAGRLANTVRADFAGGAGVPATATVGRVVLEVESVVRDIVAVVVQPIADFCPTHREIKGIRAQTYSAAPDLKACLDPDQCLVGIQTEVAACVA